MITSLINRLKNAVDCSGEDGLEVYEKGTTVFVLASCRSKTIDEWVRALREMSGQRINWHYIAGRACIRVLGDVKAVRKAIYVHNIWCWYHVDCWCPHIPS